MGGIAALVNWATGADDAPEEAAQVQADSTKYAADLMYQQWKESQASMEPWRRAGSGALNQLSTGLEPGGRFTTGPSTIAPESSPYTASVFGGVEQDPGYQWRMDQGRNQLLASGAAAGNYGSGNMGVALLNYGQGLASQEYTNAYNRWKGAESEAYGRWSADDANKYARWSDTYNRDVGQTDTLYNRLAGLSGTGQTTTMQTGQLGAQTAQNIGSAAMQGANATAQGIMGNASNIYGMTNNMSNQAMSGLGTWLKWQQQQQLQNNLMGQGGGDTPGYYGQSYYGGDTTYNYPGAY